MLLIENQGTRKNTSPNDFMKEYSSFWTIDGKFFSSAEMLLKEVQSNASLSSIVSSLKINESLPQEPIYCIRYSNGYYSSIFNKKEVVKIGIYRDQRRVDLLWGESVTNSKWIKFSDSAIDKVIADYRHPEADKFITNAKNIFCAIGEIEISNYDAEVCIKASDRYYFLPNHEITRYIQNLITIANNNNDSESVMKAMFAASFFTEVLFRSTISSETIKQILNRISRIFLEYYRVKIEDILPSSDLVNLCTPGLKTFNPSAWDKRESVYGDSYFDNFLF